MTKAKTIDRLEWTRKHSPLLETHGEEKTQETQQELGIPPDIDTHQTGDICPHCGNHTLIHTEGCEHCNYCGYDACAWREV